MDGAILVNIPTMAITASISITIILTIYTHQVIMKKIVQDTGLTQSGNPSYVTCTLIK